MDFSLILTLSQSLNSIQSQDNQWLLSMLNLHFNVCQLVAATNRPLQAKGCLKRQVRNNDACLIFYTTWCKCKWPKLRFYEGTGSVLWWKWWSKFVHSRCYPRRTLSPSKVEPLPWCPSLLYIQFGQDTHPIDSDQSPFAAGESIILIYCSVPASWGLLGSGQRRDTGQGSSSPLTGGLDLTPTGFNLIISYQNWKTRTVHWTRFTKAGWAWHVTIY